MTMTDKEFTLMLTWYDESVKLVSWSF